MKSFVLSVTIVCGIIPLSANEGKIYKDVGHIHSHECIKKADIELLADKQLASLVYDKKIPNSWLKADALDVKKRQFEYTTEWLVRFKNTQIEDKTKQVIYIFINLSGEVVSTTYTDK